MSLKTQISALARRIGQDIAALRSSLSGYATTAYVDEAVAQSAQQQPSVAWDDVSEKPDTFQPTLPIPWSGVSDKPDIIDSSLSGVADSALEERVFNRMLTDDDGNILSDDNGNVITA